MILDAYLENVREVERQSKTPANPNMAKIQIPNAPIGELEDFAAQVKVMYDLLALAYQADLSRVATYVTVAEGTNRSYPFLKGPDGMPISGGFHPISHHSDYLDRIQDCWCRSRSGTCRCSRTSSRRWRTRRTARDRCWIIRSSCTDRTCPTATCTAVIRFPNLIVGGANGKLKQGGQHLVLKERTPIANLHLTLLQKVGHEQDHFGDSTGHIAEI